MGAYDHPEWMLFSLVLPPSSLKKSVGLRASLVRNHSIRFVVSYNRTNMLCAMRSMHLMVIYCSL